MDTPRAAGDRGLAAAVPGPAGLSGPAGSTTLPAEDDMELLPTDLDPERGRSPRPWIGGILAVLVIPLLLATSLTWGAGAGGPAARAAATRVVSPADLEQAFGIRLDLVAVIAAGGLVNVRFTVVDTDKAGHVLHDNADLPALYVEARGAVLRTSQPKAHKMTILDGASYFLLYPNSGGVIQAGTGVSIVIGDVRLEPITAQS